MGTVVFPDAKLKIYLTASAQERANRRFNELKDSGLDVKIEDLLYDIQARDERDMNRSVAPLVPAADAIIVDTTLLNAEQVFNKIYDLYKESL